VASHKIGEEQAELTLLQTDRMMQETWVSPHFHLVLAEAEATINLKLASIVECKAIWRENVHKRESLSRLHSVEGGEVSNLKEATKTLAQAMQSVLNLIGEMEIHHQS
jgi:hypothetical protein